MNHSLRASLCCLAGVLGAASNSLATVRVTLYSGATALGSADWADGGSISISDAKYPGLTLSQIQSVDGITIAGTTTTGAYSGIASISLSTSGSKPTTVVVTQLEDFGGLSSSSARPVVNFNINIAGGIYGATTVDTVAGVVLGGTLSDAFTVAIGGSATYQIHEISSAGVLNLVSGNLALLKIGTAMDGTVLLQSGTLSQLTLGTSSTVGRLGGSVIATSSGSGGVITAITGDTGGSSPLVGRSLNSSGDPTVGASIWAKNGIGRIAGTKIYADVRANGNFTFTPPGGSSTSVGYTAGALMKLQSASSSDWFKGSISAARFSDTGTSEFPGISVAGAFDGPIKLGTIGYINGTVPVKIEVGSVPTDPSGGVWLDLTDASVLGQLSSADQGVITGQATGSGTTTIVSTNGRLGSIKARAIVPTAPGTGFSTTLLSTPHISSTGTMGRITTARLSGEGGTTVNGQNFQAGDCMAVIKAGTSTAASTIDGIDTDGRLEGTIDALSIGDSTIKGGTTGSLIAGTQGGDLSVFILTEGVRSGNVFRTQRFANASSGDQFKVAQGAPGSPGLIIYNADMSQAAGNDFGWQQPLVVATTSLSGRSTSSTGPSREFGTNHVKSQFRYTGANTSNVRGFTAGGAPFGLMIYDSYPSGRVGFDAPAVDLTTFLDGTTPIRLRYNGPVTLPRGAEA